MNDVSMQQAEPAVDSMSRRSILARGAAGASLGTSAAVVAACGAFAPPSRPVQGTVLVLSYQTTSPRWEMQVRLYEEFNAKHESGGLKVEFVNPGQSVMEKAMALHAAGTPADMFEWPRLWREIEAIISDLSSFFKRDKIDQGIWIPDAITIMKQGDKLWGMPISISTDAMGVNLDLFAAAGLQPPPQNPDDRSWSMEKFVELAQKLTRGTEQFGFGGGYTGGPKWMIGPTYFGYGPIDWRTRKVTLNTPGSRQAYQYWVDLAQKHHVQPIGDEANRLRSAPNQNIFLTGKVAMQGVFNLVPLGGSDNRGRAGVG
ncbi:MAG: extracellular solute-binding protein [Chloroflexi bacterium]|nr:extracellular solute-binding protein [Chloroflexota bacterium]